ncbi:tetratricopeptide repeat protein [Asticcacaulis sp. AC402]|uniref:tetratricopeptide repeat protein n=1 Tax=Asticcacaulis sp. AC402 TaxID=1282361 RepID=UPI0003C3B2B2|nr:tetratricopeptide repeat protein [Asticcacaulis sp. AC402]ESQ74212.1 hypothetical protein ABAC402_15510 [Asticcacaulis sp. AC402]
MKRTTSDLALPTAFATAMTIALAISATHAAAAETCPARVEAAPSSGAPVKRDRSKLSPRARQIEAADKAYQAGDYDGAEAILRKLTRVSWDKADTRHRSLVRLARIRIQQGRYDEARDYARAATKGHAAAVKSQSAYLLTDIEYRQGTDIARARYDAADTLLKAGDLDASEAAFLALKTQPCPYPSGYQDRVQLKLASVSLKRGNVDEAEQRLALVGRGNEDLTQAMASMDATIAQKRTDLKARTALAEADAKVDAGDVEGGITADRAALADHPTASFNILAAGKMNLAGHLSVAGRFDEARAVLSEVKVPAGEPDLLQRRVTIEQRIETREQDSKASALFTQADAIVASGQPRQALASYDTIIANPQFSPDWKQRSQLRKASILRRHYDYAAAKLQIDAVAAAPANPSIAENAAKAATDLSSDFPDREFRGALGGGLQTDDNAPAIVAALPGEEGTVPYAAEETYADAATSIFASGRYRHRLGAGSNYLVASGVVDLVDQWDLDLIDRASMEARTGLMTHLPAYSGRLEAGVLFGQTHRGGQQLSTSTGAYASYDALMGNRRLNLRYQARNVDDRRAGRDGWRHAAQIEVTPAGRYGLSGGVGVYRDQFEDATLRQTAVGVSGDYRWQVKAQGDWQVDGTVSASARWSQYRDDRKITRLQFEVGPTLIYKQKTEVQLRYGFYGTRDDSLAYDRNNNQISVSIVRRF